MSNISNKCKSRKEAELSRSALMGLSEYVWNECIIITIISKCEEQQTYSILASPER